MASHNPCAVWTMLSLSIAKSPVWLLQGQKEEHRIPPLRASQEAHLRPIPNLRIKISSSKEVGEHSLCPGKQCVQSISRAPITSKGEKMKVREHHQPLPAAHRLPSLCTEDTPSAQVSPADHDIGLLNSCCRNLKGGYTFPWGLCSSSLEVRRRFLECSE